MKILIFDNYDSFTYNLVHLVEKVSNAQIDVFRNNEIALEEIGVYDKILLSPGPGLPSESGILLDVIKTYGSTKSIFGVCLGLQAIAEVYGAQLINLDKVYHGLATPIHVIKNDKIFKNIPATFKAGRYHSWVVDKNNFSPNLNITALDDDGYIMAARHNQFDACGVQFHPESILSEFGETIIQNWINE